MVTELTERKFHGKILLFGEYSILEGSYGLIFPYKALSARLDFESDPVNNSGSHISNEVLREFAGFLSSKGFDSEESCIDLQRFRSDVEKGLYFRSAIPEKYGLGSSGALCAAVYDAYRRDEPDIYKTHEILATMESHFHGHSSGIDPLCIYYDKPVFMIGKKHVGFWHHKPGIDKDICCFLIDTGGTAETGDLVRLFRKKIHDQGMALSFTQQYIPLVNDIIQEFICGEPEFEKIIQLSVFQQHMFNPMIPLQYRAVWQFGIDSGYYAVKLCGSGGGGMILGFSPEIESTRAVLHDRFQIKIIPVELFGDS